MKAHSQDTNFNLKGNDDKVHKSRFSTLTKTTICKKTMFTELMYTEVTNTNDFRTNLLTCAL